MFCKTVIDASGEVVNTITATDEATLAANIPTGCEVLDGACPTHCEVWWNKTTQQWIEKPAKPAPYFRWDAVNKTWVDHRTVDEAWKTVRSKRNKLLEDTDWTQLKDVALATADKWAPYRQALRDVTQQTDPFNIVWPIPPA